LTALGDRRLERLGAEPVERPPDLAVLLASRAEPERFAELFDRYHGDIHRYAANRLGGERADDVAAETFLIAFRTRDRYRHDGPGGGNVRAWLYGVATNLIRRQHSDEERRYRALARAGAGVTGAERTHGGEDALLGRLAAGEWRSALAGALAALPARERDVLLLVAVGQLDYAEVAAALGIATGTVGSRLSRARAAIRTALGGADPTSVDEGI